MPRPREPLPLRHGSGYGAGHRNACLPPRFGIRMPPAIVYEDAEIVALYQPGASAFTLVTFGGLANRPQPGRFWAQGAATQLGLDCIGLIAKRENWYPTAAMRRAAEALAGLGRPRRAGFGHGMGGFAALKHGRRLGLQRALAVAPPASIDPAEAPFDRRFRSFFQPALHPDMWLRRRDLADWSAAVLDPWGEPEGRHAPALAAAGAALVAAPFLQGQAIFLLNHPPTLGAALERLWACDAPGLRRLLRARRAGTPRWYRALAAAALRHHHPAWAERLAQQGAAIEARRRAVAQARQAAARPTQA